MTKYAQDQGPGFTNRIERVAIVGATGNIGKYYTKHLLSKGTFKITALTRSNSNATFLPGVEIRPVDYSDVDSLVPALEGQDVLVVTLAVAAPHYVQANLIKAAARAGVRYVVPSSQAFAPEDDQFMKEAGVKFTISTAIQQLKEAGGPQYIYLNNSFWYEFSLAGGKSTYGFDIPNRTVTFIDDGTTKISTSTWDQCGRALASLLSLPELPQNSEDVSEATISHFAANGHVFIQSFLLSQRDILDSLHRVLWTTDADWTIDAQEHSERYAEGVREMQEGKHGGFAKMLYTRVLYPDTPVDYSRKGDNELLGLPVEDLDEATGHAVELAGMREGEYGASEEAHRNRLDFMKN